MSSRLTGFSAGSNRRVVGIVVIFLLALASWVIGRYVGAAVAVVVGVALVFVPWRGQPAWSWAVLALRGRRPISFSDPITVASNRSGGGVRVQDGVAVVAVQLLGRAHRATTVTGSVSVETENVIDVVEVVPMLQHPLGLELDSISVVSFGSRCGNVGDYPRVYDAEIGTPPYAGRRETWLIMRLPVIDNTHALRWRTTVGATAVSAAQRAAGLLRCHGLRARMATATDLIELDRRLGWDAVSGAKQKWKAIRGEAGWMTTYAYPAEAITSKVLAQAWTLRVDEVIQNVTVYPGGLCTATLTVRTPTQAPSPPSVILRRLNGEQAAAAAANMCGPRPRLRGLRRSALPEHLIVEIGPSGVLVGKLSNGDRLMIPVTDAGELSRVRRCDRQADRDSRRRRRRAGVRAHPRQQALGQRANADGERRQYLTARAAHHRQRRRAHSAARRRLGDRGHRDLARAPAGHRHDDRAGRHDASRRPRACVRGCHRTGQRRGGESHCGRPRLAG